MGKKGKIFIFVALATLILLILPACNKIKNVSFCVTGNVVSDVDFSHVDIYVNGVKTEYAVDADGNFEISGLNGGDTINFYLEGYDISPIKVADCSLAGVMVTAKPKTFTVSVNCPDGQGAVSGDGDYLFGSEATLSFSPAEHYLFDKLIDTDGVVETSNNSYRFTVRSNKSFTAVFKKIQYEILLIKNYPDALATATTVAAFGDTVVLDADDCENYLFSKWIVNGAEITSKHYEFALSNTETEVEAVFLPRLKKPVLAVEGLRVSWGEVLNAEGYEVYVDGVKTEKAQRLSLNLADVNPYSGGHVVAVVATGGGYARSEKAEVRLNYTRPLDTPKNSGIARQNDKIYYVFSKVLGATDYSVSVNGNYRLLSCFVYEETENEISIDLSDVLLTSGEYTFAVKALGETATADSAPTDLSHFVHSPPLIAPSVTLSGGVLSWSHTDGGILFDVIVAGVTVKSGVGAGSLNLTELVETESAEITVIAKKEGYSDSYKNISYIK